MGHEVAVRVTLGLRVWHKGTYYIDGKPRHSWHEGTIGGRRGTQFLVHCRGYDVWTTRETLYVKDSAGRYLIHVDVA